MEYGVRSMNTSIAYGRTSSIRTRVCGEGVGLICPSG